MKEKYRTIALFWLLAMFYPSKQKFLPCPHSTTLKLSSLFVKICVLCGKRIPWPLKDKQKPLL